MSESELPNNLDLEEEDRGLPPVNRNRPNGPMAKVVPVLLAIFLVAALYLVNQKDDSDVRDVDAERLNARQEVTNLLGPAPAPPPLPRLEIEEKETAEPEIINTGMVPPPPPVYQGKQEDVITPQDRKRMPSMFVFGDNGSAEQVNASLTPEQIEQLGNTGNASGFASSELGNSLKPTQLDGVQAGMIADRNMFVTRGAFLDCALETAISSDVGGMTSCRLTRDVYSTSGKVILLERGSRVTGEYQGGLEQGKARIFVLWSRVETPTGVIVNLDSPGTDALGRGGHSGYVETHFWERFGGAIMLSLIDDFGNYLAAEASNSGDGDNNSISYGSTRSSAEDSVSTALENSIDIPNTLIKHQGDHISIFVARDLDFRTVYSLRVHGEKR